MNDEEIVEFRNDLEQTDIAPLFLHAPYLLNLATGDDQLYERSIDYLSDELFQAERLGAQYVIVHAGNRMTNTEDTAFRRVSQGIHEVLGKVQNEGNDSDRKYRRSGNGDRVFVFAAQEDS